MTFLASRAGKDAQEGSAFFEFVELLRSFPQQAILAMGARGVAWATAAGTLGLLCCAVSLAVVVHSLSGPDFAANRVSATRVTSLERAARMLMRTIHLNNYGALAPAEGGPHLQQAWSEFESVLAEACPPNASGLRAGAHAVPPACRAAGTMRELLAPQVAGFATSARGFDKAVVARAMAAYGEISDARIEAERRTDAMIDGMAANYLQALIVLTFSTMGFAGAGIVLILLVGRASMRHFEQWRNALRAADAAIDARDLLRETIEAVPAGIVVYDRDERLLLFNAAAARITPALAEPGSIGRSYEELSRESAQRLEAEGHGKQPLDRWLSCFRRGEREVQALGECWYAFSEQQTPNGRTVGLRLDVSELKLQELEAERANMRYQSLVDSLSDVVYELDVESGRFTFASAAVANLLGVPAGEFVGKHFLEVTAPDFHDEIARSTTRPYDESDRETVSRFVMQVAGGKARHVELRARRRLDERGKLISAGVIRDIEERVQLERRLAEEATRLRAMFETGGAMVALLDRDLRYIMVNREFTRVTGRTPQELIGRTFEEVFGQPSTIDRELLKRWLAGPLPAGRGELMNFSMTLADREGRKRHFNVTANPVADEQGLLRQIVFLSVEDTERREALDLLKETIDSVPAGIVVYDQQERLVMFNEAAKQATPVLRQPDVIGITYEELARQTARLAHEFGAPLQNSPDEWIERFRSKGVRRMRQSVEGRWFEWSEKLTSSGRTVGLRVDVTDLKNREFELERARAQYEALVDSLADVVYTLDVGGRFTFASRSAFDLLGVPSERLLGHRFVDYLVPEQVEYAIARAREHYKSSDTSIMTAQLSMRRADGTIRHVEVRYRKPAGGVSDELVQVGTIRDVTERVDLTERLQKQVAEVERGRAEYEALVDSLSDLVVKIDAETAVVTFVSAAAFELWGYPASEVVGKRVFDFVAAEDLERVMGEAQALLEDGGGIKQLQYRARARNGAARHVEARFRWMPGADGRNVIVGVTRDIEQRVQLERRLAEEMTRLRSIVESSGAMIVMVGRDLRISMVNSEFVSVTGIAEADALGRPLKQVVDCPLEADVLDRWLNGRVDGQAGRPVRFSNRIVDPAGNERIISVTATPVVGRGGELTSIVFLGIDDTERRATEQMLYDAERLTTVGEMAATLAHEISQPLQVINIACGSAADEIAEAREKAQPIDAEFVEKKLTRIGQQLERAVRIVGELRGFVRGTADEPPSPFDPGLAVQGAIDLTSHGVRQVRAVITATMTPGLPQLMGHVGRLEQVLVNLINNARDAGSRTIEVSAAAVREEGRDLVRIAVEDNGPGIDPQILSRLFNSFVTTKPRGKGTGLGLRICRRIVEDMGGTISAINRAKGGARFEILLPIAALH